ncbi:MAG: serine hydrolase [Candidatus Pacebacteria bacterium]|nr:serine hydrolase [Candidatus Paceibacterota bacterium]
MRNFNFFLASFFIGFVYFGILTFTAIKAEQVLSLTANLYYYSEPLPLKNPYKEILKEIEIDARAVVSLKVDKNGKETILYKKNEDALLPIASLTKLMTALVIFDLKETYNPFLSLPISKEAAFQKGVSILSEGELLTVEALVHISLIESSNDAAFALSEMIGEENFVNLMNIYAKNIGLEKTKFINSTGLNDGKENLSTANDVALLAKTIKENYPQIFEITRKKEYEVLKPNGSFRHLSKNTNVLLFEYPQISGGKTGFTNEAKGCLVIIVDTKDGYIINIILGANDRFEEMRKLI